MDTFKPCYVWPNEVIPFRLYYSDDFCRIFIIENLQHNFDWLSKYRSGIKDSDHFIVIIGCYYHEWLVDESCAMLEFLELDKNNFHILFNDTRDKDIFEARGFNGDIINQNAWIDENKVMRVFDIPKVYDAIYVGRRSAVKRHMLACKINNLALVAGDNHGNDISPVPPAKYINSNALLPDQVCTLINESFCGLILSEKEGACFASSEYLLCGVPVVSTKSEGGRSIWYNEYNSRVVDPDADQIEEAVSYFKTHKPDPHIIRESHIIQAEEFRRRFMSLFEKILKAHDVHYIDSQAYFTKHFIHKMRPYVKPCFDEIFAKK